MAPKLPIPGGCNCGEVRYLVTKPPLASYICHCHLCQKRTGSAFSMTVVIPAGGFELVAGNPTRTERLVAGGAKSVSQVCASCYSRINTQREGAPTLNVRAGTLDDTSWLRPIAQIWTSSAQPWALVRDDIVSYEEQPTDFAAAFAAAKKLAPRD